MTIGQVESVDTLERGGGGFHERQQRVSVDDWSGWVELVDPRGAFSNSGSTLELPKYDCIDYWSLYSRWHALTRVLGGPPSAAAAARVNLDEMCRR